MKRKLSELILILIFYLLQSTVSRGIAIGDITPNFMIVLPIIFGFLNGKNEGIYVGLVSGLMYDLFTYDIIGFSSLMFMYAGFVAGCFYQKYETREILFPIMLLSASSLVFGFVSYIGNFLLHNKLDIIFYVTRFIIPEMIYTVLVTVVLYKPLVYLNKKFESRGKRRKNFD